MTLTGDKDSIAVVAQLAKALFGPEVRLIEIGPQLACHVDGRMYVWHDDSDCWYLAMLNLDGYVIGGFTFSMVDVPIHTIDDIARAFDRFDQNYIQPRADDLDASGQMTYVPGSAVKVEPDGTFSRPLHRYADPDPHNL